MSRNTKIQLALMLGLLTGLGSCAGKETQTEPTPQATQTWPKVHCPPWDDKAPLASELLLAIRNRAQSEQPPRQDVIALVDACVGPHRHGLRHSQAANYPAWKNVKKAHAFAILPEPDWPAVIDEMGHGP